MSFSPLPAALLTDLAREPARFVVELGSGDGRFTRALRGAGARVIACDRSLRGGDDAPLDVAADAEHPPFRDLTGLAAGNLLRHLWDRRLAADLLRLWIDCLAPGGVLWILEDEPAPRPGPADTYRRLQDWLARVVPWRRPLLARSAVEPVAMLCGDPAGWDFGTQANQFAAPDPEVVLSLLRNDAGIMADDAASLAARVSRDGISYGDYWWARYERKLA